MRRPPDRGSILPIVLVVTVVLSLVVVGVARYTSGTLRYGRAVEAAGDRVAAADAATDQLLESIRRGASPCTLTWLADGSGYSRPLGHTINDVEPSVECQTVSGQVNAVDAMALVLTGLGAGRTGPLLEITNGSTNPLRRKTIDGPIYLAQTPRGSAPNQTLSIPGGAPLTLQGGDLWYSNGTCPAGDVSLPSALRITPSGYGTRCLTQSWATLFPVPDPTSGGRKPDEPGVSGFTARSGGTPPAPDARGCYVWLPGTYDVAPSLVAGSYNYFRSGEYHLHNLGSWSITNAYVLVGRPEGGRPALPGHQATDLFVNNPCYDAWISDPDPGGAAMYLGGNSNIRVQATGALEISGRNTPDGYHVALQALEIEGGINSAILGNARILAANAGSKLVADGLVWAPYAAVNFDVTNTAAPVLTGGAVISELIAGASDTATNSLVSLETAPTESVMVLEATATNDGTSTVRTRIRYRSDHQIAVLSRRLTDLTPE